MIVHFVEYFIKLGDCDSLLSVNAVQIIKVGWGKFIPCFDKSDFILRQH